MKTKATIQGGRREMHSSTALCALIAAGAAAGGLIASAAHAQDGQVQDGQVRDEAQPILVAQADDAFQLAQAGADVIVVTGARAGTSTFQSLAPVQVVTSGALEGTGQPDLRVALSAIAPSYLARQDSNGSSAAKPVRAASLRGLGGSHALVLVNGKRRHSTALLNNTGGSTSGVPVDLALIPAASVGRIEVLSDGASAQYGSDAIAGVINIILKNTESGGRSTVQVGQYDGSIANVGDFTNSGFTAVADAHTGFALGANGGFLNITGEYRRVLDSNIVGPIGDPTINAVRRIYADGNGIDPREYTQSRYRQLNELVPWGPTGLAAYNLELPLAGGLEFYSNGTIGVSSLKSTGTYRNENNPATVWGFSPDGGYVPTLDTRQFDWQAVGGVRGDDLAGWRWDLSLSAGRNRASLHVNGINASFGGATPYQEFYTGSLAAGEIIANFDVARTFQTGWFSTPLDFATGVEFRHNTFNEGPGEFLSYANGGYIYPDDYPSAELRGRPAGLGSPFMSGIRPEHSGDWERQNGAVYVDFGQDVTENLRLAAAARYEYYSDFGGTLSGKLSARYEIIPELALRATVNNAFRAPSLAEQNMTVANQGPFNTGTQIIQVNAFNSIRLDDPAAIALGARPLEPETSINFNVGLVARPLDGLSLSLDAYQIDIDDRIGLTGQFNGTANTPAGRAVADALVAAGIDPTVRINYFTNIGDTRTRGVEFKADYLADLQGLGQLNLTLAHAYNENKVTRATEAPPALAAAGLVLLQDTARNIIEDGQPKHITRGVADWSLGRFGVRLAGTHYSSTFSVHATFPNDATRNNVVPAAFITDVALSYQLSDWVDFTVGANNVFNKKSPDTNPLNVPLITTGFVNPTPLATPYGRSGGAFYYARLGVSW